MSQATGSVQANKDPNRDAPMSDAPTKASRFLTIAVVFAGSIPVHVVAAAEHAIQRNTAAINVNTAMCARRHLRRPLDVVDSCW